VGWDSYSRFANSHFGHNDLIKMVGGPPLICKIIRRTCKGVVLARKPKAAESVSNAQSLNITF
jgi:ribosomal protein S6--L-glutamate ligase